MEIRQVIESDYYVISPHINEWWGGRQMSDMLPRLFFDHFKNTSFIAEQDGVIVGFLIGFLSQSTSNEAYIHFVGVHPKFRKHNIGRKLYNKFFNVVEESGRTIIRCVTSPVNKVSVEYHTKMGFEIQGGGKKMQGVSVMENYDGPGEDRILFIKHLV
ncbi:GNAT family N-acetyltransferase [Fictibacillus sp. BK138]|uniref:GNAT family N-acetyltransferase n=1 Tax=Fictibacillus sp. BK138 TaxID=2512121 RepID=UPI001029EBAF|nr:GNAT family N-acetyltransferase [Fictibacillus sp. BK138]RZT15500.1 ribosomal protein S18 acetylase RimI-like enzyme [Fictibacillus sp. BK138]